MGLIYEIFLQCDGWPARSCPKRIFVSTGGKHHKKGPGRHAAIIDATNAGWVFLHHSGGGEYCPQCAAKRMSDLVGDLQK